MGIDLSINNNDNNNKGIIKTLQQLYSEDLNGIIKITVSSTAWKDPKIILKNSKYDYWYSKDEPYQWIQFEFLGCCINLKEYQITTYKAFFDGGHLQSWALTGSEDGINWIIIDEHYRDSSLNGENKSFKWKVVESPPIRFIKLTQTGRNTFRKFRNNLIIKNIEFFGKINPLPFQIIPIPPK